MHGVCVCLCVCVGTSLLSPLFLIRHTLTLTLTLVLFQERTVIVKMRAACINFALGGAIISVSTL